MPDPEEGSIGHRLSHGRLDDRMAVFSVFRPILEAVMVPFLFPLDEFQTQISFQEEGRQIGIIAGDIPRDQSAIGHGPLPRPDVGHTEHGCPDEQE